MKADNSMTFKERRQFLLLARVFVAGFILLYVLFELIMAYLISSLSLEAFDQVKTKNVALRLHLNTTARKNLIIFSHGRSGSSITGDIFNQHPDVFYLYEPLQTVERTREQFKSDYDILAQKFLKSVFQCRFDEPNFVKDMELYYRRPIHPLISRAIASPPLCPYNVSDKRWDFKVCAKMTTRSLENACRQHKLTVIKVLIHRVPYKSLQSIISACAPKQVDCKIVFLVRDPRAVVPSSLSVDFYREQGGAAKLGTRMFSYNLCEQTEANLEVLKNLPAWLRNQVKLLRYEDLAGHPIAEMKRLYKFAGLSVLDSVTNWLNRSTHPSKQREDVDIQRGYDAAYTVDDAEAAINRWRWKVTDPNDITTIEMYCKHVMQLMGYRPVHNSYELQRNISIPLHSRDFEAEDWLQK